MLKLLYLTYIYIYIYIYDYCCAPFSAPRSPAAARARSFHFYCSSPSEGNAPKTLFHTKKILALSACSPNITKQTVSAPVGQKCIIYSNGF